MTKECSQCKAYTATGERCKRTTCKSQYCWVHLKAQNLAVKTSSVPNAGQGLFAVKNKKTDPKTLFSTGDAVTKYQGKVLNERETEESKSDYIFRVNRDYNIDALATNSSAGRYANDCKGTGKPCNLRWKVNRRKNKVTLVAKKPVKQGEELFVSYGPGYWKDKNLKKATKKRKTKNSAK